MKESPISHTSCEKLEELVRKDSELLRYFSEREYVRSAKRRPPGVMENSIAVPEIDLELSVEALCKVKHGESCAVFSPYYESRYMPYPLIFSARSLLLGQDNAYFLVVGEFDEWAEIIKTMYFHGTMGNYSLTRDYDFRRIGNMNLTENRGRVRKPRKRIRWVFSGFSSSELWEKLDGIALIVVDLISKRNEYLEREKVELTVSLASKMSVPAVYYLRSPLEPAAKYLHDCGVQTLAPIRLAEVGELSSPRSLCITKDEELRSFLTQYNLRSNKISTHKSTSAVDVKVVEDDGLIREFYQKFLEFSRVVKKNHPDESGKRTHFLALRFLDSVMEFPGSVKRNSDAGFRWLDLHLGRSKSRFSDSIWNLSEETRDSANELIYLANDIMTMYEQSLTPKGKYLVETLRDHLKENKKLVILGDRQTLSASLQGQLPYETHFVEHLIVPRNELEETDPADEVILMNPLYGRERAKLLTSCTEHIIILNYPWQIHLTELNVEAVNNSTRERSAQVPPMDVLKLTVSDRSGAGIFERERQQSEELDQEMSFDSSIWNDFDDQFDYDEEENFQGFGFEEGSSDNLETDPYSNWRIPVEGGEIKVPENRKIVLIRDLRSYLSVPSRVRAGDRILIASDFSARPLSDFVWGIMENRLKINRKNHPSNEWRELLRNYQRNNPELSYPQIYTSLRQYGEMGVETPAAIYLWLQSQDIIGPKDRVTLETIAKFFGVEEKVDGWYREIQHVRSVHNKIMRHLWQVARYSANVLRRGDPGDDVVDRSLGIRISDLSKLMRFVMVTGEPKRLN